MQKEYKTLSSKTKRLLKGTEGVDVDFKRNVSSVSGEDIVAFANSRVGGSFLIGVDELKGGEGVQKSKIVGCTVDDRATLAINNKAAECDPPIKVDIFKENLSSKKPILRVSIASSKFKPHCTKRGVYRIRQDNRNRGLLPQELLSIFLDKESDSFIKKFQNATQETEYKLNSLNRNLYNVAKSVEENLDYLEREMFHKFEDMVHEIELAYEKSDENSSTLEDVWKMTSDLHRGNSNSEVISEIESLSHSVDAILDHHSIKGPNYETKVLRLADALFKLKFNETWSASEKEKYISLNFPFVDPEDIDLCQRKADLNYERIMKNKEEKGSEPN